MSSEETSIFSEDGYSKLYWNYTMVTKNISESSSVEKGEPGNTSKDYVSFNMAFPVAIFFKNRYSSLLVPLFFSGLDSSVIWVKSL
jgi:hypothetical protein